MSRRNDITTFRPKGSFSEYLVDYPSLSGLSLTEQLAHFRTYGVNTQTSCFFREGLVLRALKEVILPSYSPDKKVRIASVGCSSGEDLYSVLFSNWDRKESLCLHGFDINPKMIAAAKKGILSTYGWR